jgi:hypothetical protein
VQVRDRLLADLSRWKDRVGLAVVGHRDYTRAEIERFASLPVVVEIPFDSRSAATVAGRRAGNRRLSRSTLLVRTAQLASTLSSGEPPSIEVPASETSQTTSAAFTDNEHPQTEALR